ncbi:MAG: efflux RND transporter periplasmic adaptor subunit [Candidatus Tectomicrobia bacterium]|nr:efflux RND transporter periplasmic adaptor subunit [Candidatus Tectomicrobia bacterium]
MKGRHYLYLLLVISILGVALFLWGGYSAQGQRESQPFQIASIRRRSLTSQVLATGIVKPMVGAEVKVGSRISGTLNRLFANVGDTLKKGDIIAKLDDEELKAQVDKAKADLMAAEARLALIERGSRAQEIEQARLALKQAEINLETAKRNLERQKSLFAQRLISQQQIDAAQAQFDLALSQHLAAEQQVSLIQAKYTSDDLKLARAQVEQAKANLRLAETQLSYATITAPISGVVASVSTQEGEVVAAGLSAPTFITIINLDQLQVDAYVDETDIGKVKVEQEVVFSVDAYPEGEFRGKVMSIYPKAVVQANVVTYDVAIALENAGRLLKPDMTTNVTIFLEKREDVIAVPNQAIRREEGARVVYVLENGIPVRREVKTGWKDSSYTEVVQGLQEGEKVVIGEINLPSNSDRGFLSRWFRR